MSGRKNVMAWIGLAALALLVTAGPAPAADVKLGATFSLTGGTDDYGKGALMGFQLAVEEYKIGRAHV